MAKKRKTKHKTTKLSPLKHIKTEPEDVEVEADVTAVIDDEILSCNPLADVSNDGSGYNEIHKSSNTAAKLPRHGTREKRSFRSDKKSDVGILPTDDVVSLLDEQSLRKKYSRPTKETLRSLMAMDLIGIRILSSLSVNTLGELFSMYDSDELSRQFFYHCQLMPSRCKAAFRSYGNENKAKAAVERHLKEHIDNIMSEGESSFVAESIQARQRRIENECNIGKQKVFVKLERLDPLEHMEYHIPPADLSESGEKQAAAIENKGVKKKRKVPKRSATKFTKLSEASKPAKPTSESINDSIEEEDIDIECNDEGPPVQEQRPNHDALLADTSLLISKNAEILSKVEAELQLSKQPYLDHQYAVLNKLSRVSGRYVDVAGDPDEIYSKESTEKLYSLSNRHIWDTVDPIEASSGEIQHNLALPAYVIGGRMKTSYMLAVQHPLVHILPSIRKVTQVPAVGEEVVIERSRLPGSSHRRDTEEFSTGCIVESDSDSETVATTSLARPYPPMPKYQPEMGAKLIIPEEDINLPNDENENEADMPEEWDLTNEEHMRKYAIKCMRELKQSRGMGSRNIVVSCKICERQFTAVATLMYHYRSHAKIKPFVCLLCDATFTRQHSLNYHMLIHNGASRFKCPDCGRAFRHPSHYKEHQRRHTGEQPYACHICTHRFKTRNSYKRHMWSKHPGERAKSAKASTVKPATIKPTVSTPPEEIESNSGNTVLEKEERKNGSVMEKEESKNVAAGPVVTMKIDKDNPAVKLIAENGNEIDPKQVKFVPLSMVKAGQSKSGVLPTNILRNKDGKPIVLTLSQAKGSANGNISNKQNPVVPEMSTEMKVVTKEIFEHFKAKEGKVTKLDSSSTEDIEVDIMDTGTTTIQDVDISYDKDLNTKCGQESRTESESQIPTTELIIDETKKPSDLTTEVDSVQSEEDNDTSLLCLDG